MGEPLFTKDLSKANRSAGLDLLGYFWRASVMSKAPYYPLVTNWNGFISYMDKSRYSFIESLGELQKSNSRDKMIGAMVGAANRKSASYQIASNDIGKELLKMNPARSDLSYVAQATSETAVEVGGQLLDISKYIGYGLIAYGVIYLLLASGSIGMGKKFVKEIKG